MGYDPLQEFSGEPITSIEAKKLRKIIRDQERMDWVWATGRIWVGYAAAALAAWLAVKDWLIKMIKTAFS